MAGSGSGKIHDSIRFLFAKVPPENAARALWGLRSERHSLGRIAQEGQEAMPGSSQMVQAAKHRLRG